MLAVTEWARQTLQVLAYLHDNWIVHRRRRSSPSSDKGRCLTPRPSRPAPRCRWEWVLGTALSSTDGREAEARAVLEKSAARAPGTWIATSLTQ